MPSDTRLGELKLVTYAEYSVLQTLTMVDAERLDVPQKLPTIPANSSDNIWRITKETLVGCMDGQFVRCVSDSPGLPRIFLVAINSSSTAELRIGYFGKLSLFMPDVPV
ncbi:hypothetical protein FOXB_07924 [Fusarium oxysporum f. sp. conglutinans Fo5176]|uniref:Uncharacterized protein n=1 Tax=Fusarium oxysporum (strain Fo5176) TaxID=660025 RepID=F9FNE4_FUSOF|nr:hypothetical protein FOXB_07924 [Fusarium oxysporum f. sp. conglutinans Fo5176]